MNSLCFLTQLSYSVNVIEYTDDEQLPLPKKMKVYQRKPICGTCDWVILIIVEFTMWLKVEFLIP